MEWLMRYLKEYMCCQTAHNIIVTLALVLAIIGWMRF